MKLEVPFEWKTKKLNQVSKVTIGLVTTMTENYVSSGVPLIRNSDIKENKILKSRLIKLETSFANQYPTRVLLRDDIVTVHTGDVGVSSVIDEELEGCFGFATLNTRVDKSKLYPQFLCWYFNSSAFLAYAVSLSTGDGRRNLNLKDFSKSPVPVPPLLEQIKIAEILSTWDNAINTVQKLLANSQQQKKVLMQQLLTGKKRFSGFEGKWDNKKLENVLYEESPRNKGLSISRVLSITNHSGFVLPQDQFSKRVASDDVSNYKVIKKGQFGYNPSRLNVGSFARLNDYDLGILSPMYVIFSLKEDKLCSDYFLFWMQSNEARQRVLSGIQGSVRASVGFDDFAKFSFKLPSLAEQQKIAAVLTTANQEIDNLRAQLNHLKQEKKALMQQLLTGKRRVKVEEAA